MSGQIFGLALLIIIIGYIFGNILFGLLISKIKHVNLREIGSGNVGATNTSRALGKRIGILVLLCDMIKGWLAIMIASVIYQTLGHSIIFQSNLSSDIQNQTYIKYGTLIYLAGFFAIVGHCFPIFYIIALFRFKFNFEKAKQFSGGKGAAATAGVFAAISPWIFLCAFLVFMTIFLTFRYVSLSSMIAISTVCLYPLIPRLDFLYMLNIYNINTILPIPSVVYAHQVDNIINYNTNWEYILTIFIIGMFIGILIVYKHKDNIQRLNSKTEKPLFNYSKNKQKNL